MLHYKTRHDNGEYRCDDIRISREEWLALLCQESVFTESAVAAVKLLYNQPEHRGSCSDIEAKYHLSSHSYNARMTQLAKRVCKATGVEIVGTDGAPTYWVVLMASGKVIRTEKGPRFEWRLRPELVEALRAHDGSAPPEADECAADLESRVDVPNGRTEGKKVLVFSTRYERSRDNRTAAVRHHGTRCMACGFDFEEAYGEVGRGYVEVHHVVPIAETDEEVTIDPSKDLVCLCANCHRMVHRNRHAILSVAELRALLKG